MTVPHPQRWSENSSAPGGSPYRPSPEGRAALIVAGVGGLLTLVAFLALPHLTLPLIGSVTLPSLIAFAARFGGGGYGALWLIAAGSLAVVVAGITVGTSATSEPRTRQRAATVILAVAAVIGLGYLLAPLALTDGRDISAGVAVGVMSDVLAVGYWVGAFGVLTSLVGALTALVQVRRADR